MPNATLRRRLDLHRPYFCFSGPYAALLLFGLLVLFPPLVSALDDGGPRFRQAASGYQFHFPGDHGSHDEFRTEWWYYTGHLIAEDGRTFGYELTFFRQATDNAHARRNPSRWAIRHLYLAHAALSEHDAQRFRYAEKISRAGIEKAGADADRLHVWIDHWSADSVASDGRRSLLRASSTEFSFDLLLEAEKAPILHGDRGLSRKGVEPGQASHYYSLTRLTTSGTLMIDGHVQTVHGVSWMDHEFGSGNLGEDQVGWDWFSVQLDNRSELMFYFLRRADGSIDPVSSGTLVFEDGQTQALSSRDISIEISDHWTSPSSGARYPSGWRLSIPSRAISLHLIPKMPNQELITRRSTQVTYWEGAVKVFGRIGEQSVAGQGYVELTGYATPIQFNR
jgi:predicted secreted hydrolase